MQIINPSSTFTRPADTTAYTANDLVANSTTAGSVVPMAFPVPNGSKLRLIRASISFNSATVTNAKFKLHLYSSSPTCTNGDNGAWLTTNSGYLDNIAIDCTGNTFSDAAIGYGIYVNTALNVPMLIPSTSTIYGLLQATAAYTPISGEVFTVSLLGEALL